MTENKQDIAARMRDDWNRRVRHDYRFWMSDGTKDDAAMWESGARDYSILMSGITPSRDKVFLEIGCGVGRLLRPAANDWGEVIGLDVSSEAVNKAKEFLKSYENVTCVVGSGVDLQPLPDSSIDFVVSFAAITSMPTAIIAQYLLEMRRVIKPSGTVKLQIYLGQEQDIGEADTLHLRCFDKGNFEQAARVSGFGITQCEPLVLPFEVSFKELGIEAFIVTLSPQERHDTNSEEVARILLQKNESPVEAATPIEFWMSYNHAKTLILEGDFERAQQALTYAADVAKVTALDVSDLLNEIVTQLKKAVETSPNKKQTSSSPFNVNLETLKNKFPLIAEEVLNRLKDARSDVAVQETIEGPSIVYKGQILDHPSKPKTAGESWAKRTLQDSRCKNADSLYIFGFGSGYHIDSLLQETEKGIFVIEPSWDVFIESLHIRDCADSLSKVSGLWVGEDYPRDHEALSKSEFFVRPQHQALFGDFTSKVKSVFYGARGVAVLKPAIGVLGPLQGGTLPITEYVHRALPATGQKGRAINMSGFAKGFHEIEGLIYDKVRRAIAQSNYVQFLSSTILESITEKPIDILICMAQAPISAELLNELRKRGIITVLWFAEDYLRFTYWQQVAQYFDYIFTIQEGPCIEAIKKAGAGSVHYLPMGCDPVIHSKVELTEEEKARWGSPISFVGAGYHNRQQMFAFLADLPFKIWGTEWPTCRPFDHMVQEQGRRLTPEEYVKIFCSTDININLHSSTERDGVDPYGDFVNPRTFELASCKAFQLVDERTHLPAIFTPGKEIVTFNSLPDLREKIEYYLAHPEERKAIAEAAYKRVISEHTYGHRIRDMLSVIYSDKFEHIKARVDASPWAKMRQSAAKHEELSKRVERAFLRGEEPTLDGLVSDIVTGNGDLTETEQKLLFLHHIRAQMIRMRQEESGEK